MTKSELTKLGKTLTARDLQIIASSSTVVPKIIPIGFRALDLFADEITADEVPALIPDKPVKIKVTCRRVSFVTKG